MGLTRKDIIYKVNKFSIALPIDDLLMIVERKHYVLEGNTDLHGISLFCW